MEEVVPYGTSKRRSAAWDYFVRLKNKPSIVKCILCKTLMSFKCRSTMNLMRHIKTRHPNEYPLNMQTSEGETPNESPEISQVDSETPELSIEIEQYKYERPTTKATVAARAAELGHDDDDDEFEDAESGATNVKKVEPKVPNKTSRRTKTENSGNTARMLFSEDEISLLVLLSKQYYDQLESKKVDNMSNYLKRLAWETIEKEFNELSLGEYRDGKTLRKKYENMKIRTRDKYTSLLMKDIDPMEEGLTENEKALLKIIDGDKETLDRVKKITDGELIRKDLMEVEDGGDPTLIEDVPDDLEFDNVDSIKKEMEFVDVPEVASTNQITKTNKSKQLTGKRDQPFPNNSVPDKTDLMESPLEPDIKARFMKTKYRCLILEHKQKMKFQMAEHSSKMKLLTLQQELLNKQIELETRKLQINEVEAFLTRRNPD